MGNLTQLNNACAALKDPQLGTLLNQIITLISELKTDLSEHVHSGAEGGAIALVNDLKAKYNAAVTLINELKTDLSGHVHGGITAGTADTAAAATIAAVDAVATAIGDAAAANTGAGAAITSPAPSTIVD